MDQKAYRPDIDGLRAVAVGGVLLNHARLGLPGGFVGVDVFFVISGFLITSIITREMAAGTFRLQAFWERRIRRILPALAFVAVVVLIMGWLIFLPFDLSALGRSMSALAVFGSNFYFYLQPTGYFTTSTQPLLHTWSLAVEEQFYLILPLMMALGVTRATTAGRRTVWALFTLSLSFSVIGVHVWPQATFYLMPSRAWELLLGALVALTPLRQSLGKLSQEVLDLIGLSLIAGPMLVYSSSMPFPGLRAIAPCLGAALLIWTGGSRPSIVGRCLALRPLVFIGLISYSLYLWHWPILAFSQYLMGEQRWPVRLSLLGVSIVLSVISWRYVETPFRTRRWLPSRSSVYWGAGILSFGLGSLGLLCHVQHGFPARFSRQALTFADTQNHHSFRRGSTLDEAARGQFIELGDGKKDLPIRFVLWGDSHAMGMAQAFDELGQENGVKGVLAAQHGTPPLNIPIEGANNAEQIVFSASVRQFIKNSRIPMVFLTAHWKQYANASEFTEALKGTVGYLTDNGVEVYFIMDVPDHEIHIPTIAALREKFGISLSDMGVTASSHQKKNARVVEALSRISGAFVKVIDPAPKFLNDLGLLAAMNDDNLWYTDGNHLSVHGARHLKPLFQPIFERLKEGKNQVP